MAAPSGSGNPSEGLRRATVATMTTSGLPLVVERWVAGFARSRGVSWSRAGEVLEVPVDSGGRRLELVLVEPRQALLEEVARRVVGTTDVWTTVLTVGPWTLDLPQGLRVVLDDEVLMTSRLESRRPLDEVGLEADGDRLRAVVRRGDVDAASGWVAVVGQDATFDRVLTHPDHRRQGLGRAVMTGLGYAAHERGARTGLLAASVEGQALYGRLGWGVVARMTTLAGAERTITTP